METKEPKGFEEMTPEELIALKEKIEEEIKELEKNYEYSMKNRDEKSLGKYKRQLESKERRLKRIKDLLNPQKRDNVLQKSQESLAQVKRNVLKSKNVKNNEKEDKKNRFRGEIITGLSIMLITFVIYTLMVLNFLEMWPFEKLW